MERDSPTSVRVSYPFMPYFAIRNSQYSGIEMDMDVFCDIMKKYRMNSVGLFMQFVDYRIDITKEQCLKLFNIFKPTTIKLNSRWSNRWEAILQVKEVVSFPLDYCIHGRARFWALTGVTDVCVRISGIPQPISKFQKLARTVLQGGCNELSRSSKAPTKKAVAPQPLTVPHFCTFVVIQTFLSSKTAKILFF